MSSEKSKTNSPNSASEFSEADYQAPPMPEEYVDLLEYQGKLHRLQYEKMLGELESREEVMQKTFCIARILRDKLLSLPAKLAPVVTAEMDEKKNYEILNRELKHVIREIQHRMADHRGD